MNPFITHLNSLKNTVRYRKLVQNPKQCGTEACVQTGVGFPMGLLPPDKSSSAAKPTSRDSTLKCMFGGHENSLRVALGYIDNHKISLSMCPSRQSRILVFQFLTSCYEIKVGEFPLVSLIYLNLVFGYLFDV